MNVMRRLTLPALLGLAHGVSDATAGFLLGLLPARMDVAHVALLVMLYNVLAFAAQPAVGWWLDRTGWTPRGMALVGLALMLPALVFFAWSPALAVVLAGAGSATFHVGGGAATLRMDAGRARGLGLFLAPGVIGLTLGTTTAAAGQTDSWPFLILLMLVCVAVVGTPVPHEDERQSDDVPAPAPSAGPDSATPLDLLLIGLVGAIALRSAVWTAVDGAAQGRAATFVLTLGVAAGLGKAAGGFLADWAGWRRWATFGLVLAAPPLLGAGLHPAVAVAGAFVLQANLPVTVAAAGKLLPRQPAMAAACTLGLATALGGLPGMLGFAGFFGSPVGTVVTLALAAVGFWFVIPHRHRT